jgi:hypothetical protein
MKILLILAASLLSVSALGQSLEQTGTLHRWDYLDLFMGILSTMGGGAALAAWVPMKSSTSGVGPNEDTESHTRCAYVDKFSCPEFPQRIKQR